MSRRSGTQPSPGMRRQLDIYQAGVEGHKPTLPLAWPDLEERARADLTEEAFGYLAGGAGSEETMTSNREAFRRWKIVPRMLQGVTKRDLSVELVDRRLPVPLLLAPIGVQGIMHRDGEVAVARAAAASGIPVVLSTVSSKTLEDVAEEMGESPRWFQLYWPTDPELTNSFLERAEGAGYEALVITVDTLLLAWRPRDLDNAYLPFLFGEGLANYFSDPVFRASLEVPPEQDPGPAVQRFADVFANPGLSWDHLSFIREHSSLPFFLKGILRPDDARRAVDAGAAGIVVSNHGGRQIDGEIAALDALPAIVDAAGDDLRVVLDSGVRTGSDVLKAMALGASAVMIGRPYVWALAIAGEDGVREYLENLVAEIDLTLGLAGYESFDDLGPESLVEGP